MLSLKPPYLVSGNLVLFRDDVDDACFYYVNQQPHISRDDTGAPVLTAYSILPESGADVNATGTSGVMALMLAAAKNPDLDVVRALLKSGADACAKDVIGHDALWYAQMSRREQGQKEQLLRILRESASC